MSRRSSQSSATWSQQSPSCEPIADIASKLSHVREAMASLPDPRNPKRCEHRLEEIVMLTLMAVICGADSFVMVELFGQQKEALLRTFLELPAGIPSHDTLGRVFSKLRPQALSECLGHITKHLSGLAPSQTVALDGKTLRRSFDRAAGKTALHMVSAFASASGLVLGQRKSEGKKNEIRTLPKLLSTLDVEGDIVTTDAMGTQTKVAAQILEQGADFVLALKANHPTLHNQVKRRFACLDQGQTVIAGKPLLAQSCEDIDKAHGRLEQRQVTAIEASWLSSASHGKWAQMVRSVVRVQSTRDSQTQSSCETRYFLSSLAYEQVSAIASAIRDHWQIENGLHWVLDVTFRQDHNRMRKDHTPENFALLQSIALNLLRSKTDKKKLSIPQKRFKALANDRYLLDILHL